MLTLGWCVAYIYKPSRSKSLCQECLACDGSPRSAVCPGRQVGIKVGDSIGLLGVSTHIGQAKGKIKRIFKVDILKSNIPSQE